MSQDKQPHSTHQADSIMLTLVLILAAFGLLILFSASEYNGRVRFHDSAYYFKKQLFATALGLGAMYLVSSIDYHFFVRLAPAAYLLSMLLSTAVLLFGQEINGSKRWLNLGPLSFQPSEFAKVSVVLFLTWQIERSHKRTDGFWFMCRTMLTLLPIVGLVGSNNLSTAIIILGIGGYPDLRCQPSLYTVCSTWWSRHRFYRDLSCCGKLSSGTSRNLARTGKI